MAQKQALEEAEKYKNWRQKLETNQVKIRSVDEKYTKRTQDGKVLYALVEVEAETPEGTKLPPVCMLKGHAVSMLVVLIDEETEEKSVLLVRQRRICDGSETYEHPAGMIDEGEEPIEVAARELKEETGLVVTTGELRELFPKGLYSATSTSDEALFFFYTERRMSAREIQALHNRPTGEESENEHTHLYVTSFPEAQRLVSNLHGVLGHLLYLKIVQDYKTLEQV
ncbi:hypothetical protein GCM10023189_04080 [Nibrella saemangeumensis]|uniref:GDP-mannose pyrophosphatase n=1 Tax=Nibrella saemangeumensis TaxID=1084526 RepID=A0ABP8MAX0_9BACT